MRLNNFKTTQVKIFQRNFLHAIAYPLPKTSSFSNYEFTFFIGYFFIYLYGFPLSFLKSALQIAVNSLMLIELSLRKKRYRAGRYALRIQLCHVVFVTSLQNPHLVVNWLDFIASG